MEKIKKETLLKLIRLSDLSYMESSGDMQDNLEKIQDLLEKDFAGIYADYLLED